MLLRRDDAAAMLTWFCLFYAVLFDNAARFTPYVLVLLPRVANDAADNMSDEHLRAYATVTDVIHATTRYAHQPTR